MGGVRALLSESETPILPDPPSAALLSAEERVRDRPRYAVRTAQTRAQLQRTSGSTIVSDQTNTFELYLS